MKLARLEADALARRADAARVDARARGADGPLQVFERALVASQAVVNVDIGFLLNLLSSEKTLCTAYAKLVAAEGLGEGDRVRRARARWARARDLRSHLARAQAGNSSG